MKFYNLFIFLCLSLCIGCYSRLYKEKNDIFIDKKVILGENKSRVLQKMGKPKSEINFRFEKYAVCILDYGQYRLDYTPVYEEDDMGIIPAKSGVREEYKIDYRLFFINTKLYAVKDFIKDQYYTLSDKYKTEKIKFILNQIKDR